MRDIVSIICLFFLCSFTSAGLQAQDIHFSQFYMSPMSLNPAMTGDMDVEYRFAANQRTQWKSVTSNPYSTFSISAESAGTFDLASLGTSLYILNDKAGDGTLNTFALNLGTSYGLALNLDSSSYLRGGIQLGFTQRSIDFSGFRFDEQYNGRRRRRSQRT